MPNPNFHVLTDDWLLTWQVAEMFDVSESHVTCIAKRYPGVVSNKPWSKRVNTGRGNGYIWDRDDVMYAFKIYTILGLTFASTFQAIHRMREHDLMITEAA